MFKLATVFLSLLPLALAWPTSTVIPTTVAPGQADAPNCVTGEILVKDYIQFECWNVNNVVELRPIGCSPDNDSQKPSVKPGEVYSTEHFKYECVSEGSSLVLKVINCIDATGKVVDIGSFFTMDDETTGIHTTTECLGDYFNAKKTVHQWTKCVLSNGQKLTEGNFHVEPVTGLDKPLLQKGEIVSCIRDEKTVNLVCTGCVTEHTSIHVGISGYINVLGQWTQCRRFNDKCRLVNVTQNYVDCRLTGEDVSYQHGIYFNDTKGISTYYCNHGFVTKQGCNIQGKWGLVGEVIYTDSGDAFLCDTTANGFTAFNGLKGCVAADGSAKRFQEVWQEGLVMKRCSFTFGFNGIADSKVLSYACVKGLEVVPENKIMQLKNGLYEKCVKGPSGDLEIRLLTPFELHDYLRKKTRRLDLNEYYANGGKGLFETIGAAMNDAASTAAPLPTPSSSVTFPATESTTTPESTTTTSESTTTTSESTTTAPESTTAPIGIEIIKDPEVTETSTSHPAMETSTDADTPQSNKIDIELADPFDKKSLAIESRTFSSVNTSDKSNCADLVPYCAKLASYCPDFDKYQVVDQQVSNIETEQLNSGRDLYINAPNPQTSPCEALFMTHQKKLKLLVNVICKKTCNSCLSSDESDRIINRLQSTSRCG